MSLEIRSATADDVGTLLTLVRELAEYEGVQPQMQATPDDYRAALSGPNPRLFAKVAYWSGKIAGCIVWYETFSTFAGKGKVFIEDIFVKPEFRGKRIGRALIAELAKLCMETGYAQLQWSVLAWNKTSIGFYRSTGAKVSRERLGCSLVGDALQELALERICCLAEDGNCSSSHCERCDLGRSWTTNWSDPVC